MVKNLKGGKGSKGLARKGQTKGDERLRLPECELELFACVTKMYGNGMCEIYTNDNTKLIGHIRNKFRGRQKRNNMITVFSIVMIGLREWENPIKNCDILCIYDVNQIEQLRDIPNININNVLIQRQNGVLENSNTLSDTDNLIFTNDIEENNLEYMNENTKFNLEMNEEINIDDI
jgi:translation initiation factor IF-1